MDLKRVIDGGAALVLLVVLAPILLAVAATVYVRMGRPILFQQLRPGRNGVPFLLFKFRSMQPVAPGQATADSDAQRLTGLGAWLRASSLDELPELWNVLKGEMSLVGPRPLLVEYLPRYNARQSRRHEVRPGITGWAQVNGRNAISWEERLELDVWYVDNQSIWLDLMILRLTVFTVLFRRGIQQPGQATCAPFTGNPPHRSEPTDLRT